MKHPMVSDGLPKSLIMTPAQRNNAWLTSPPRPMPQFIVETKPTDPSTLAFLAELEAQQQAQTHDDASTPRTSRPRRPERPSDTFLLRDWASENSLDPREVRAAARSIRPQVEALQCPALKYTFPATARDELARIINEAIRCLRTGKPSSKSATPSKKTSRPSPATSSKANRSSKPSARTQTTSTKRGKSSAPAPAKTSSKSPRVGASPSKKRAAKSNKPTTKTSGRRSTTRK